MKIIVDTKENVAKYIADAFSKQLCDDPCSSLAFTADESIENVLGALEGDFSKASFFNICDFVFPDGNDEKSNFNVLRPVLNKLHFESVHSPDPESPEEYDEHIARHGGLDLILLGMSTRGTIGFNEPATPYDTHTRTQKLTDVTRESLSSRFGGTENVPEVGVTMGLKTICGAKKVILAAFGSEKADAVHKLVYGKTTTYVPAAMLQMHRDMILCLDKEAAEKL